MEIVHTRGNGIGRLRMICYLQWWYTVFVYDCHCFQSSFNTSNFIALRPFGKAWMGQDLDHPNICKLLETYEQGRSLPWLDALIAKKVHVDSCWSHGQHVSLKQKEVLVEYLWASGPFHVSWCSKKCYKSRVSQLSFSACCFKNLATGTWGFMFFVMECRASGLKLKRKFAKETNARKAVNRRLDAKFLNCSFKTHLTWLWHYNIVPVSVHSSKLCLQSKIGHAVEVLWGPRGLWSHYGVGIPGWPKHWILDCFWDLASSFHWSYSLIWPRQGLIQESTTAEIVRQSASALLCASIVEALGIGATSHQRVSEEGMFLIVSSVLLHPFGYFCQFVSLLQLVIWNPGNCKSILGSFFWCTSTWAWWLLPGTRIIGVSHIVTWSLRTFVACHKFNASCPASGDRKMSAD